MSKGHSKRLKDTVKEQPFTYDDYAALPEEEGIRHELVDGKLEALSPSPNAIHQLVSKEIEDVLTYTCKSDYVILDAPIDMILSDTEVRQPDFVMIHRDRLAIITKRGIEQAPDLVAEILSPYTAKNDRFHKRFAYATFGVPEYWIIDPNNELLEQYMLHENDYELQEVYVEDAPVRSPRIPCISFTMQAIFDALPELPGWNSHP